MIRCIPVDGSEPFEVRDDANCENARQHRADGFLEFDFGYVATLADMKNGEAFVCDQHCRIESWRERAERLEAELAALHSAALTAYGETVALDQALDAIENRSTVSPPQPTRLLRQE